MLHLPPIICSNSLTLDGTEETWGLNLSSPHPQLLVAARQWQWMLPPGAPSLSRHIPPGHVSLLTWSVDPTLSCFVWRAWPFVWDTVHDREIITTIACGKDMDATHSNLLAIIIVLQTILESYIQGNHRKQQCLKKSECLG
jgi:hypothetical protein